MVMGGVANVLGQGGHTQVPDGLPYVKSSSIRTSSSYFGDLPFEVASPRLQFSEDLYTSEVLFCASSLNYQKKTPVCVPCNYTGPSKGMEFFFLFFFFVTHPCPDGVCTDPVLNVNLPQLASYNTTLDDCECNPKFCDGIVLKSGLMFLDRHCPYW